VAFANALSQVEGLEPCYTIRGSAVAWNDWYRCTGYRLPTSAEWEVAARGGQDTFWAGGGRFELVNGKIDVVPDPCELGNVGNEGRSKEYTRLGFGEVDWSNCDDGYTGLAPVGTYLPNGYGLYDMTGNAGEWVWDWYTEHAGTQVDLMGPEHGTYRLRRGGGFTCTSYESLISFRSAKTPDSVGFATGIRLVRTQP